jgi:cytidylate kinase
VNAGQIFRETAAKRKMALAEFATYVAAHPAVDRALDAQLVARARAHRDIILEGRLAGWMTKRARIPALRIWVTARENVRVDRLMQRDGDTRAATLQKLRERTRGEAERYRRTYRVDLADRSPYDMLIATDAMTSRQLAATIIKKIRTRAARAQKPHL